MKYMASISLIIFTTFFNSFTRGCCSHHGGVDYCGNNGYYICSDGTRSPSCQCFKDTDESFILYDTSETYIEESDTTSTQEELEEVTNKKSETAWIDKIGLGFVGFIIIGSIYYGTIGKK